MAHFYGTMQGSRGEATRCGTKQSGISAHVRSGERGISAEIGQNSAGDDFAFIRVTTGSYGSPAGRSEPDLTISPDDFDRIHRGDAELAVVPLRQKRETMAATLEAGGPLDESLRAEIVALLLGHAV